MGARGRPRPTITKTERNHRLSPNLVDYDTICRNFSWDSARLMLAGLPGGRRLNIGYEAVDRYAAGPLTDHLALRWLGKDGSGRDFSYADLRGATNQFANVLRVLGVARSERLFVLAGRIPELYIAALGTLKIGCVFCPLFCTFGTEPIHTRLSIGEAKVLVTTEALYRRKVAPLRDRLPKLEHVILVGENQDSTALEGTHDWQQLMAAVEAAFEIAPTDPEDMALLHFTSGTTAEPKGAVHVHEAVVAHHVTGKLVLDMHPQDVFWCTADPSWVTGTSYGMIAPLTCGITNLVCEAALDATLWHRILQDQRVTVWYTAPTAIRILMKQGAAMLKDYDLSDLRLLASVGEPVNPEAVVWSDEVFGMPFHDNWWPTETGRIMIANYPSMDIRLGSMGKPLPGVEAAIVRRIGPDAVELADEPGAEGELALRPGWPSMFRGYLHEDERYRKCFVGGWYLVRRSRPARRGRLHLVRRPHR